MDRVLTEYQHRIRARLSNVADQYTVSIPPPPPIATNAELFKPMTMPNLYQQIDTNGFAVSPKLPAMKKNPNPIQWFNIISYILIAVVVFVVIAIFYFVFNMQYD